MHPSAQSSSGPAAQAEPTQNDEKPESTLAMPTSEPGDAAQEANTVAPIASVAFSSLLGRCPLQRSPRSCQSSCSHLRLGLCTLLLSRY
jgi:hypothetical protein